MMGLGLDFNVMYNKYMKFGKEKLYKICFIVLLFIVPVTSLAQSTIINVNPVNPVNSQSSGSVQGKIKNPIHIDNINDFILVLLQGVIKIGIPIIALAIIYCGFLFVAAQGNSEKLSKAKDALIYTIIGAAILLGAWALAQLISETVLAL